jgi:hypothetical protein
MQMDLTELEAQIEAHIVKSTSSATLDALVEHDHLKVVK